MSKRSTTVLAGFLVPAALALGACGDDGGVSKEEFAAELDEVCVDIEDKLGSIEAPDNPAELGRRFDEIRAALRSSLERMRGLDRPEGEAGTQAREYIDKVGAAIENDFLPAFDELERAVKGRDEARIRAAGARLQGIDEGETQELARDLGADECAESR